MSSVPEFALGDSFTLSGTCRGASGPADLTDATVRVGIRRYRGRGYVLNEEATIVGDPEGGATSYAVTPEKCAELGLGEYEYEFEARRGEDYVATFPASDKPRFAIVAGIVPDPA